MGQSNKKVYAIAMLACQVNVNGAMRTSFGKEGHGRADLS